MKNRFLFVLISISLLLSACAGKSAPTAASEPTETPIIQVSPIPPTATKLQATETPSPEPTATPLPTPRGTLSLTQKFGFGTGLRLSPYGLQLSVDEKRLIATTSAGIFVFSAADLSPLLSIYDPTQQPGFPLYRRIRISRDGSLAAGLSLNAEYLRTLKFWDLSTGSLLAEYPLQSGTGVDTLNIADFAISPDNSQVVAVSEKGLILVINVSDGKILKTLDQYINNTQTPLWIEYDPIGKNVYYLFQDVSFTGVQTHGLNSVSWEEVSNEAADTNDFPWLVGAFAPKLSKPAGFRWGYFTMWGSHTVSAWDYSSFGKRFDIKRQDAISSIAFSPDGQWVVMGSTDPAQLEVWPVDTVKAPAQTFAVAKPLWALAAASDGQTFYGISNDGSLSIWKSGATSPIHQQQGFIPIASVVAFTEDGLGLQLTIANNEIYQINPQDGSFQDIHLNPNILEEMKGKTPISATISADKRLLAVLYFSTEDYAIRLFDLASGKLIRKIPSKNWLESIEFAPDGQSLFTFSRNKPVQVLNIENGQVLKEIPIKESLGKSLLEMCISRDKSTLVFFGETGVIEIYRAQTLELLQTLESGPTTSAIAISDDGSLLAYYGLDTLDTLNCWDIASNTLLPPLKLDLPTSVSEIPSLAFSPDNHRLAFATWDGVIRMYNVAP